jgi:5-methylthioadenosine/S-adenosylhomocysteine deaminase
MPESTLFEHAIIVTMDEKRSIIEDGSVVVSGSKILDVGPSEEVRRKHSVDRVIEAKEKIILPGLVSLHFHSDNFSRGVGEHMGLEEWLDKIYYPMLKAMSPDDAYKAAMVAYAEAIRSGTTTVNDMYRHIPACAEAAEKIGIRAVLSSEAADLIEGQETLEDNERAVVAKNGAAGGRIKIWFGAEWVPVCSPEFFEKTRELADKYKVGIHVHLNESSEEVELCKKKFGQRPVEHVDSLGLLGNDVVAAHCVWLSDKEIKLLAKSNTQIAHCPVSNAKLGNGVARVPEMRAAGLNIGLGPDDAPCNNSVDMFEVMKFASLLQKATELDASIMPSRDVLQMATINGARALQMENEIGSIELGKKADLILLDTATPRLTPIHLGRYSNILPHIVYAAHGDDVHTVMIDGRIVMENRRLLCVNECEIIKSATDAARELIGRIS